MKKAEKTNLKKTSKMYFTPSSSPSSFELENALLGISDWQEGGHFSLGEVEAVFPDSEISEISDMSDTNL